MPFLSLIVPTMRVGGLDFLFDSLKRQTFTDFELVLIDGLHYHRDDIVEREAKKRFLKVVHVEPSPNPFPLCAFCQYMNAGIRRASGEVVVHMVDYSRLPPGLLAAHAAFHRFPANTHAGLMGPHRYVAFEPSPGFHPYGPDDIDDYQSEVEGNRKHGSGLYDFMFSSGVALDLPSDPHRVDGGRTAPPDADPKLRMPTGPIDPSFFHAKNESVRLEHILKINGWDEALDGAHLYQDTDFAERLSVKAGVRWHLDPTQVVDIINPRNHFPFAKRVRPHETNRQIWQNAKLVCYPNPNAFDLRAERNNALRPCPPPPPFHGGSTGVAFTFPTTVPTAAHGVTSYDVPKVGEPRHPEFRAGAAPLHLAMIYGEFSSAIHGPFDIPNLNEAGLTGSESSFFNLARTLAERGHNVVVFCVTNAPAEHPSGFHAVPIRMLERLKLISPLDAVIAWNEPDYLRFAPPGVFRICDQQLNDWGYCSPGWKGLVDTLVFPSESSRLHHVRDENVAEASDSGTVIPNSVALELFEGPAPARHPHRVVYSSSPDRGLHHLLAMWPRIRKEVPDAELKIFYRIEPWLARARDNDDEVGRRARYIEEVLPRLAVHGVEVVGPVANARMALELRSAAVLAYPCDPVRYTEGFGCSVLDAAAGGCVSVISNADALEEVHMSAGFVIRGRPVGEGVPKWVGLIAKLLTFPGGAQPDWQAKMAAHAASHSRQKITDQWETLIRSKGRV